ncbi:hypothetical protein [Streptomyces canus]|uniref:hypothetical protein n=1 Tax=Streptomyces canus TaxID=58343 RepID=UPI0027803EA6|nr:hypothetical protein [Streptomyces canus]MDQ0758716.1 hypothetical protein [Streptomyces canus]
MPAICEHTRTAVTTEPQHIRIRGNRTHVDIAIAFTATCPHGHQHTLHIVDIQNWDQAIDEISYWTNGHIDACPGPTSLPASA